MQFHYLSHSIKNRVCCGTIGLSKLQIMKSIFKKEPEGIKTKTRVSWIPCDEAQTDKM